MHKVNMHEEANVSAPHFRELAYACIFATPCSTLMPHLAKIGGGLEQLSYHDSA